MPSEGLIDAPAEEMGRRVGVQDDEAHEPATAYEASECREAYRSLRKSANSSSDSQASG